MIYLSDQDIAQKLAVMVVYGGKYVTNDNLPCKTVPEVMHAPITLDSSNLTFMYNSIKIKRSGDTYIGKQNIYAFDQGDIVFDAEKNVDGIRWTPWKVKQNNNIRDLLVLNGVSMIADPVIERVFIFDTWLKKHLLPSIVGLY